MKLLKKVIEDKNMFGDIFRVTIGVNPVSGKFFKFANSLRSTLGHDGKWSHTVGKTCNGFANWDVTHVDGLHPEHDVRDVLTGIDIHSLPDFNGSW